MAAEMNDRRELVLKLVIQEFIENPLTPVASELLVRKYGMNVSSATIRNEMAALEDLGYLTHSHTSAGRVPTDAGYRYYVENLMDRTPLSATEQRTIRHQFYQVRSELDQWIQLAGAGVGAHSPERIGCDPAARVPGALQASRADRDPRYDGAAGAGVARWHDSSADICARYGALAG